jgi:hypothetical protein
MLSRKDPTVVMEMIKDDTPRMMKDELPEFFNNETALTHFDEKDRKIEMCYHTISMLAKLKESKVKNFDNMKFQEIERKTLWIGSCPSCGATTLDRDVTVCQPCHMNGQPSDMLFQGVQVQEMVAELTWGGMYHRSRPKVFVKATRAKSGFTYNGLTMEKSQITQELRQPGMLMPEPEKKKKRFSLF